MFTLLIELLPWNLGAIQSTGIAFLTFWECESFILFNSVPFSKKSKYEYKRTKGFKSLDNRSIHCKPVVRRRFHSNENSKWREEFCLYNPEDQTIKTYSLTFQFIEQNLRILSSGAYSMLLKNQKFPMLGRRIKAHCRAPFVINYICKWKSFQCFKRNRKWSFLSPWHRPTSWNSQCIENSENPHLPRR